jgi:hypothetical protein
LVEQRTENPCVGSSILPLAISNDTIDLAPFRRRRPASSWASAFRTASSSTNLGLQCSPGRCNHNEGPPRRVVARGTSATPKFSSALTGSDAFHQRFCRGGAGRHLAVQRVQLHQAASPHRAGHRYLDSTGASGCGSADPHGGVSAHGFREKLAGTQLRERLRTRHSLAWHEPDPARSTSPIRLDQAVSSRSSLNSTSPSSSAIRSLVSSSMTIPSYASA